MYYIVRVGANVFLTLETFSIAVKRFLSTLGGA
jgi:hypothetical protein